MEVMNFEEKQRAKVSIGAMLSVMELVIAIGVFAIISTFLLRFFTVANRLSDEAREVSKAAITAEAIMEHIKGKGIQATAEEFELTLSENQAISELDETFQKVKNEEKKAMYRLELVRTPRSSEAGTLFDYNIKIIKLKNETVLFDFNGKSYEKAVGDEK